MDVSSSAARGPQETNPWEPGGSGMARCPPGAAVLTLDPTAAPGGQRAMPLPPGSQGFVSWGPLAADDETSTKTPLAAGRRGHTVPGPGRSALTPGGPDLP